MIGIVILILLVLLVNYVNYLNCKSKNICHKCNGHGFTWNYLECKRCKGSGKFYEKA